MLAEAKIPYIHGSLFPKNKSVYMHDLWKQLLNIQNTTAAHSDTDWKSMDVNSTPAPTATVPQYMMNV